MRYLHRFASDFETLEIASQRAGMALACSFSSSAEFEAATIQEKRAAGVYGPRRRRRQALIFLFGITLVALLISVLL